MATAKYRRGSDGYFSASVWDGTYVDGRKHRVHVRSKKSSRDLERKVAEIEAEVIGRKYVRNVDVTFLEYAREWEKVYKQRCSGNTKAMYSNIIEKHFAALGPVLLKDVGRVHLEMLLNNAEGKARTQQQIQMTFRQVIRSAVSDRLFPGNVADEILSHASPVRYSPPEKRALTVAEREALFRADLQPMDRAFVYILYGCGLRRGEALALTVFDIDLRARTLTVSKAHELTGAEPRQKEPKTRNGYRTVPLPDIILPAIEDYLQGLKRDGRTYLFTMGNGAPMTKSSYDKMWRRILRQMEAVSDAPIRGLSAHVFRHNYCSSLCYQIPAISIKQIARLMGDTEAMVLGVYNHVMLEKEDAGAAINRAIMP